MDKPQVGDIWKYPYGDYTLIIEEDLDDEYGMEYTLLHLEDGKYGKLDLKGFKTYAMTKVA